MQRYLFLFLSLASLAAPGSVVRAQPAPPAEPPPNPPATAPAAPAPTDATPPAAPPEPAAATTSEEAPRKFAVGKDIPGASFSPGLLLQGWFVANHTVREAATGDVTVGTSTFRLRRVEFSASGDIIPKLFRYRFMFDPSRVRDTLNAVTVANPAGMPVTIRTPASALSTLQDFYITLQSQFVDVSIGQFKNPVSWDGFNSAARTLMPERAFVANFTGGQRDVGLRFDKTFPKFMYSAGLFNGAGQNNLDNNNQKDVGLRLEVYPVKGMTIAGVTYDSIGYRTRAGTKDRWEVDFRYETGPYLIQSEFIRNRDVLVDDADPINTQGFYVALAYLFKDIGSGAFKGNLQPVIRFAYFDPNTDADVDPAMVASSNFGGNDERMDFELGLNYYLRSHETKFQFSYDRQQFDQSDVKPAVNEFILAAQVSF